MSAAALPRAGRFPVNRVRALFERRGKPPECRIEHRAHQHGEHTALEFVSEKECDVAGLLALRLEAPAVLEIGEWTSEILDQYLQIGTIKRDAAGEGFLDQLERHYHVGHHHLGPVGLSCA